MITLFFVLHMIGSAGFVVYSIIAVYKLIVARGNAQVMKRAALGIGSFQVVTGLGLAFVSPTVSMLAFCVRGLLLIATLYCLYVAISHRLTYANQEA